MSVHKNTLLMTQDGGIAPLCLEDLETWESIRAALRAFAKHARLWQLKEASKLIREARFSRYPSRNSHPLYGLRERAFTDSELLRLWETLESDPRCEPKYALAFRIMAARGFRPGEVFGMNGFRAENILESGDIRLVSEKNGLLEDCRLPKGLFSWLCDYIRDNRIHFGPVFPSALQCAEKAFRRARARCGLEDCYHRGRRDLQRLTMMSFRHYAITSFHALARDLRATQRFARHRNPMTTLRYLTVRKDEIDSVIERMAFGQLPAVAWSEIVNEEEEERN